MTTKKKIDLLKTYSLLDKYPIILFFQHNNLSVTDWSKLRTNVAKIKDTKILITKNSIVEKVLLDTNQNKNLSTPLNEFMGTKIKTLFQGPNFILGCHNLDQLDMIWKYIKTTSNIIFVGGLFENQVITHLDLEKLLELKNYGVSKNMLLQELLYNTLNINSSFMRLLKDSMNINSVTMIPITLLNCLNQIKIQQNK